MPLPFLLPLIGAALKAPKKDRTSTGNTPREKTGFLGTGNSFLDTVGGIFKGPPRPDYTPLEGLDDYQEDDQSDTMIILLVILILTGSIGVYYFTSKKPTT